MIMLAEENMTKKTLPGGFLFMTAALVLTGAVVLERGPLAPRADTLEGKTIYLVDLQWGGPQAGYSVFEEMQKWFSKNMPSVNVVLRRSKGGWMGDDPDLRKEISEKKAAGAVIGIGG
jgi:hypothetical protein